MQLLKDRLTLASFRVRPCTAQDMPFKLRLYGESREEELSELSWTDTARSFFIGQQFTLQQRHIAEHHPASERMVIERFEDDAADAIGHLDLDRSLSPWRVIEFTLLRSEQSRGIGSLILQSLQQEAQARKSAIDLHVLLDNARARRFYLRHGFDEARSDTPSHHRMIWYPRG